MTPLGTTAAAGLPSIAAMRASKSPTIAPSP